LFLQTKITIFTYVTTRSCELTEKSELGVDFNKGCWLRTIVKNNKTSMSDIWIPNIDLMVSQKIKNTDREQKGTDTQA
jgi:hypothetical protein